jgi:pyruvate/2-oxoacid:ferredoxin oxidoreductase alpha subunit
MSHDELEAHERRLQAKYRDISEREVRFEQTAVDDAEILLIGYGIVARILRRAVGLCRAAGIRAGLFRPITLWPFPSAAVAALATRIPRILVAELSNGQMVDDVRLASLGRSDISFYGRMGGNVPAAEEIVEQVRSALEQGDESRNSKRSEVRRVKALA